MHGRHTGKRSPPPGQWLKAVALGTVLLAPSVGPAGDETLTTQKDVRVAMRVLGFVASPPVGPTPVAILYASDNPVSIADAKAMLSYLEADSQAGKAVLLPVLVSMAGLDRVAGIRFALVAHGLEAYYDRIAAMSREQGVLSISAEVSCARSGRCVMAVTSEPRVEVTINHAAALAAHVEFSTAFRMLINEL